MGNNYSLMWIEKSKTDEKFLEYSYQYQKKYPFIWNYLVKKIICNPEISYFRDTTGIIHINLIDYKKLQNFFEILKGYLNIGVIEKVILGKTFLTNCIAKSLLDKGYTVLYLSAINLFDNILRDIIMKNNHEQHQEMLYDYIYNCDFLIIDDLGTELTNSFVQSQLFEIINKRTIRNQSTLISTNLDLKMIRERYTERIMSRIVDSYLIFNLYGDNIRYMKRMSHITGK